MCYAEFSVDERPGVYLLIIFVHAMIIVLSLFVETKQFVIQIQNVFTLSDESVYQGTWHIQLCKSCCPGSVKVSRHWFSPYGLLNGTKANVNWQQRSFVYKHILSEIGAFVNDFSYSFLRNAIAHTCLYVLFLFWNTYISLTDENYQYVHISFQSGYIRQTMPRGIRLLKGRARSYIICVQCIFANHDCKHRPSDTLPYKSPKVLSH